MNRITLSEIFIYPVKSLGGISLKEAVVEERGLRYDRRWMLVDSDQVFMTQRKFPRMALCKTALTEDGVQLSFPGQQDITIPYTPQTNKKVSVNIWDDQCQATIVSDDLNEWFSQALEQPCQLVMMPEETRRAVDPKYDPGSHAVSFADGYPFLIISQASLDDLNSRLDEPVPMNRFRPNLVVQNGEPYQEEGWRNISIGAVSFAGVKPCGRCVLTTIDQETAEKGKEPLRTLAGYRTVNKKVLFGQNLIFLEGENILRVGDEVRVND